MSKRCEFQVSWKLMARACVKNEDLKMAFALDFLITFSSRKK